MEDYAPVAPVSPPRSFQGHDAPLGSSSADPAHSFPHALQSRRRYHDTVNQPSTPRTTGEGKAVSEQKLSDFPSVSQQTALTALQHYDNATIFAWLTGLRSFRPGGENWFQPRRLSRQELEAISALKDCADSLVSVWLDAIRGGGQYSPHRRTNGQSLMIWRRKFQCAS